jgi:hypothetical protein
MELLVHKPVAGCTLWSFNMAITNYVQSPFNKARKDKFLLVLNFPDGLKNIFSKLDQHFWMAYCGQHHPHG